MRISIERLGLLRVIARYTMISGPIAVAGYFIVIMVARCIHEVQLGSAVFHLWVVVVALFYESFCLFLQWKIADSINRHPERGRLNRRIEV